MGCGGALGDAGGVCVCVGAAVTGNSEVSKTAIKRARMQRPFGAHCFAAARR
ncbi:hypothetical protein PXO_05471 [Xanthomonas oryzae pv. oryzae PXO99A]|uniref:Uncharacterized protein n=1 Tax=Xanthomonas oryzae pv. oryzae (strain PXO99A) TaxID=360094 RepID=A0A0K0GH90_XANOP|nr:hypothetical protein PXO_05471 [Xanthomonas oryzae pv. oryzae PXO99A]